MIGGGCKQKDSAETVRQPPPDWTLPKAMQRATAAGDSSAARLEDGLTQSLLLMTVQGVIYTPGNDSLAALAIETVNREVLVLAGTKAAVLREHQHQKVSITGFLRRAVQAGARDTLEVADYTFLRD